MFLLLKAAESSHFTLVTFNETSHGHWPSDIYTQLNVEGETTRKNTGTKAIFFYSYNWFTLISKTFE